MDKPAICPAHWQKLLLCSDGSPEARGAVDAALRLARLGQAQLYAVQVMELVPEFDAAAPDLMGVVEEEVRRQIAALRDEAVRQGVALQSCLRRSPAVAGAILEEIRRLHPDLVIMGPPARTGLARLVLGDITARVIGVSPAGVLVMPPGISLAFGRLLVAVDGSPYAEAAWVEALALACQAGSDLYALCAVANDGDLPEAQAALARMQAAAMREGLLITTLTPQGEPPEDAILQAAQKYEVDLIIMGSHGRRGLTRLLLGSVTEGVLDRALAPVLVVKRQEAPGA